MWILFVTKVTQCPLYLKEIPHGSATAVVKTTLPIQNLSFTDVSNATLISALTVLTKCQIWMPKKHIKLNFTQKVKNM